jgi:hypothetical protein
VIRPDNDAISFRMENHDAMEMIRHHNKVIKLDN